MKGKSPMKKHIMFAAALLGASQVSASSVAMAPVSYAKAHPYMLATAVVAGGAALYLGKVSTKTNAALVSVATLASLQAGSSALKAFKVRNDRKARIAKEAARKASGAPAAGNPSEEAF